MMDFYAVLRTIIIFLVLWLFFWLVIKIGRHYRENIFIKLLKDADCISLDMMPELALQYETYVKEIYKVDMKSMSPGEHVKYIARHFSFLTRDYKRYFPQGRNWTVFAAAANLGEMIRIRHSGVWLKSKTKPFLPVVRVTLPDQQMVECAVFSAFILQKYNEDAHAVEGICLGIID